MSSSVWVYMSYNELIMFVCRLQNQHEITLLFLIKQTMVLSLNKKKFVNTAAKHS